MVNPCSDVTLQLSNAAGVGVGGGGGSGVGGGGRGGGIEEEVAERSGGLEEGFGWLGWKRPVVSMAVKV